MTPDSDKQLVGALLTAIEEGWVTLSLEPQEYPAIPGKKYTTPKEIYCGNMTYSCSNGWKVVVFNDCSAWDYIDHVITPDGRIIDDNDDFENDKESWLLRYYPSEKVIKEKYFFND